MLVPVFMYGSETMLWKEKERSRIRAVQMDNFRGLLGIRRIDREFCGVKKGLDERIDEGLMAGGLAMWRGWRGIGLLREFIYENVLVVVQWVGRGRYGLTT